MSSTTNKNFIKSPCNHNTIEYYCKNCGALAYLNVRILN